MSVNYKVILNVSARSLPTLISTIEGAGGIDLVTIETLKNEMKGVTPRYLNGKKDKGILGKDAALQNIKAGITSFKALQKLLNEKHGFALNSVSPIVSNLVAVKTITKNGDTLKLVK